MKSSYLPFAFALLLFTAFSCNRKHNCQCSENYSGAEQNYSIVVSESELTGMKTDEAIEECDKGDVGPQTVLSETWEIDCELK